MELVQKISIWALPILFAITVHEVAHGWVASRLGDKTAKFLGRLTLNPVKHIDPIGTIVVPALCLLVGGFIFGWAKPVPVNERNLRNPKRDMALVAAAGPMANFLMALIWAGVAKAGLVLTTMGFAASKFFFYMGMAGISINVMLMVLNFLPIPPLDGSKVLAFYLPVKWAVYYEKLEAYGFVILIFLLFTNILSMVLQPFYGFFANAIRTVFML